jgi:peptidoglycan hydrolase-like protein with peptidoglycan-binding domain
MLTIKSKAFKGLLAAFVMFGVVATASANYDFGTATLRTGSRGAAVTALQNFLGISPATGFFGPITRAKVMAFQKDNGLTADGIFGRASRTAANASVGSGSGSGSTGGSTTTGGLCPNGMTLASNCTMAAGSTTGTQTGPVTAMLAATNPAADVFVEGQATATLAQFAFNGTGSVTNVTLQRMGLSSDATLTNVYLFDGATRLTDGASVSNNGLVTFNNPAGLFTVSGSKVISVRADIKTQTSGEMVGIRLNSFTAGGTVVNANLAANIHSIAVVSLATVSAGTVSPSGAILNPGSNVTVWQSSLSIGQRDVMMKRFAVRQLGSASASSFANFKLFVNGVQVATAAGVDSMGYVTFDMMSNPVTLASGSRLVRVDADIVSGASRTVQFSVRQAADVDFVDSSYNVNISPAGAPWQATASTIGGVSGGSMTVEKDTSSPTQPVSLGLNDVKLGTFKITAYGEPIKIETLTAGYTTNDPDVNSLRNGKIMINGVQYGTTATLTKNTGTSFSVNYIVTPGTPILVDVYADMFDNDGTDNLSNGDSFTATLITGSANAMRQDSLGTLNVPGATVSANPVSVASASVSVAKQTTYGNQTVVVPQTNGYKIGAWTLTGSTVEDVLLTQLSFDVDEVNNTTFSEADLTNLTVVIKDGSGNIVAAPSPIGTVNAADNNFSINYTLAKNASATVELMATIGSTITDTHSLKTDLSVTGTASVSGTAVSVADIDGQTIIAGAGSITATLDATSPEARVIADNQTIDAANFKFEALYSGYNVTDLTFTIPSASTVGNVMLYDGATLIAQKAGATTVVFNGLNWNVPVNTSKILTVKLQIGSVGVGAGVTGSSVGVTLTDFTATSTATGVSAAGTETNPAGNATYVYASFPTISNVTLPTVTLNSGTNTVSRFSVASNGGTIGWKKIIFTATRSIGGTDTLSNVTLWDESSNTQVAGAATFSGGIEADNGVAGTIIFVATNEQQISGSKTYALKLDVAGTLASGNNMNVSIAQPSTFAASNDYATVAGTTASFVWSDVSAAGHSTATTDWNNGFLIKNLPTDSQTLSRS